VSVQEAALLTDALLTRLASPTSLTTSLNTEETAKRSQKAVQNKKKCPDLLHFYIADTSSRALYLPKLSGQT